MMENRETEKILEKISDYINKIDESPNEKRFQETKRELVDTVDRLAKINTHYLRKENQLFPLLESHDVSGPTQVMWALHDDIRDTVKTLQKQIAQDKSSKAISTFKDLQQMIKDMIYKEERILYPMSLETLSEEDWKRVKSGEREIGYAWVEPSTEWKHEEKEVKPSVQGKLSLDTGKLSMEQLNLMLTHLPVDLSFVDENDAVIYYSNTPDRIFPRSPAVIGRKVQKCHPPKSVHIVNKILKEFKAGRRDVAEFWIQMNGRFIHIRYFAVRDSHKKYLGTLEVSQDVTGIKKLEGEKRLLDWS
jgi:hypothetical protein